ncbi:MAG: glycosyltransferase family 2 protein [Pedobacter sp.]|nr:glycosyltransferase family 2 protein [Pedobacter sp.]MDQ8051996.1 glycosyltransferase family 2 protein [Pedobacter sp.]
MPKLDVVPSVAVVILNWNGRSMLEKFMPSIVRSAYPNLSLVVGDNASTDSSISFLKEHYPQVKLIVNEENYGFAGGYNRVLSQIEADYFVLLNSDVEVPENWIMPVIQLMESDPMIAAAQPKIKAQAYPLYFEYAGAAGGFIDLYGYPFCRGRIFDTVEKDSGQYDQDCDIFWASGAAFFIKSPKWKEVGGLDADLFAHMEEIDLCWRLKNLGYRIVCCTAAEVLHVGGGTLNAINPYKTYLNFRNNLIIMQKNLPKMEAYWRIFWRMWLDLAAMFHFLFQGKPKFFMAISKGHQHFIGQLFRTAKKRGLQQVAFKKMTGVYRGSMVWTYFIKKIRKFSGLN